MSTKDKKGKKNMLSQEIRHVVVSLFENINEALSLIYILEKFREEHDYLVNHEDIIRDAILEGLIYVDKIDLDGTVYLGLGSLGESMWWQHR